MAAFLDVDNAFLVKNRFTSVIRTGQLSTGKDKVQACQQLQIGLQRLQFRSRTAAQGGEDDFDLFFLTQLQLMQLIIQFQYSHWFDK